MKTYLLLGLILCAGLISVNAHAGPASGELGVCLVDSLNGKERKILAKWIFFSMSEHPEIIPYVNASAQTREDTDRLVGELITRLLADDCPQKTKAAIKEGGSSAFQEAFSLVGQVAMQELMTDENVSRAVSNFEKYTDKQKLHFLSE